MTFNVNLNFKWLLYIHKFLEMYKNLWAANKKHKKINICLIFYINLLKYLHIFLAAKKLFFLFNSFIHNYSIINAENHIKKLIMIIVKPSWHWFLKIWNNDARICLLILNFFFFISSKLKRALKTMLRHKGSFKQLPWDSNR